MSDTFDAHGSDELGNPTGESLELPVAEPSAELPPGGRHRRSLPSDRAHWDLSQLDAADQRTIVTYVTQLRAARRAIGAVSAAPLKVVDGDGFAQSA